MSNEAKRKLDPAVIPFLRRTIQQVREEPDPVVAARTLARGTTIVGLMLEDIGDRRGWKKFAGWITRAGQAAWGLVELAVPRSLGEILFQHWISLAYAIGVAILAIGLLTGELSIVRVGAVVLLVVAVAHFCVDLLRRWMLHDKLVKAIVAPLFILTLIGNIWFAYSMHSLDVRIEQNGGMPAAGQHVSLLRQPSDLVRLGKEEPQRGANVAMMKRRLLLDTCFIFCYSACFLAAGVLLARASANWMARPYRVVALLGVFVLVAAASDLIENLQAFLVLLDFDKGFVVYVTDLKWAFVALSAALVALLLVGVLLSRRRR